MKKIVAYIAGVLIFGTVVTSYAFNTCKIDDPNFCTCVLSNCQQVFDASSCTVKNMKTMINRAGATLTCHEQGFNAPDKLKECTTGVQHFLSSC